jgi:hypothetical protein
MEAVHQIDFNGSLRAERPRSYSHRFPSLGLEVGHDSACRAAMIALLKLNRLQVANNMSKRLLQLIALACEPLDQAHGRSRFTPAPPKFFRHRCNCRNW